MHESLATVDVDLNKLFSQAFPGNSPQFYAKSPGRVNIIGDHTDYSYLPCLPAAITNSVVIVAEVIEDESDKLFGTIALVNTDEMNYEPVEFSTVDIQIVGRSWANYFKCAWISALEHLNLVNLDVGMRLLVHSDIPPGAGLSSSAAVVVSSLMVVLQAYRMKHKLLQFPLTRTELTKLSITCEKLVGVNSGGMDMAACIFGQPDHSLLISFYPDLSVTPVKLSPNYSLIIANSLIESHKLESATECYNLRVVEVTIAANILAKLLKVNIPPSGNLKAGTLLGVLVAKCGMTVDIENLEKMAESTVSLMKDEYSVQEICQYLNISFSEFSKKFTPVFDVKFTEKLKLKQRALHVYEEAIRVLKFVTSLDDPQLLGELMNDSQRSAEELFEHSQPDCEKLCRIAQSSGAFGSRITGAGWGGCTVHIVPLERVAQVKAAMNTEYYMKYGYPLAITETRAAGGAVVYEL